MIDEFPLEQKNFTMCGIELIMSLTQLMLFQDRGLGLAVWKTAEKYGDIEYLAGEVSGDLYTALNNPWRNQCDNKDTSCDWLLVRFLMQPGMQKYGLS